MAPAARPGRAGRQRFAGITFTIHSSKHAALAAGTSRKRPPTLTPMGSLARLLTVSWGPEGNHELEEGDADLLEESLRWRQHRGELSWQRPRL